MCYRILPIRQRAIWRSTSKETKGEVRTKNELLYVLGYLGVCLKPDSPLNGCAINQAMVMTYVSRSLPINSGVYRRVILPFIESFWRKALDRQRFRFTAPRLVADSFAEAVEKPPPERAAANSSRGHVPAGGEAPAGSGRGSRMVAGHADESAVVRRGRFPRRPPAWNQCRPP